MRASGLLVGVVLLVATFVAWLWASDLAPAPGPAPAPRAARAAAPPGGVPPLGFAAPEGLPPAVPVFAELRNGEPLDAAAAELGGGGLVVVVGDLPPALAALSLTASASPAALTAVAPPDGSARIAELVPCRPGAWVSLCSGGVLLGSTRLVPGQTLLRFVLAPEDLRRRLGVPLST